MDAMVWVEMKAARGIVTGCVVRPKMREGLMSKFKS